eukprot:Seg1403.4 transcript_id=Seg1403.4/GoldUCD/mRNA.D3Y31 product="hypothetical protein" protein_id=Seg1403.4/GoldUCD/D3Y31
MSGESVNQSQSSTKQSSSDSVSGRKMSDPWKTKPLLINQDCDSMLNQSDSQSKAVEALSRSRRESSAGSCSSFGIFNLFNSASQATPLAASEHAASSISKAEETLKQ